MINEILNLGKQPIANRFILTEQIPEEYFYNLRVGFCDDTKLITHMEYVHPPLMFNANYAYRGSMSKTMVQHFEQVSSLLKATLTQSPFDKGDQVKMLEIGSNDGVFIKNWKKQSTFAVEPCDNFAKETNDLGYRTYPSFWTYELSDTIKSQHGTMDLIFAANCICHIPNLDETFRAVNNLLSSNGVFVFEDPSLAQMINNNSYDQIYDEHPHIFSVIALKNLLERNGLTIIKVDNLTVHGGSNRIWAQRTADVRYIDSSVSKNIEFELIMGLDCEDTFRKFASRVEQSKQDLIHTLQQCKKQGKKVISYGATSKSTTVFNYCGIDNSLIDYVTDTTPEKIGKLTPGTHIPIKSVQSIPEDVDIAYLGAWNFTTEILNKEQDFIAKGGRFLTHVPIVKFL